MVNYANGKIYKIIDNTNNNIYYGSTCQKLKERKAQHIRGYKQYLIGIDIIYDQLTYDCLSV